MTKKQSDSQPDRYSFSLGQIILRILQGALIGGGAIVPGISGGVLCVTFGIYKPMMSLLANPFTTLKKHYKLFIPLIIGGGIGFIGLAKVVEMMLKASSVLAIFLFAGLIAGTIPSLFKEASQEGVKKGSWTGFALSLFIMYPILSSLQSQTVKSIDTNWLMFLFCGVVWGLSLIIPGLSSSSILLAIGLYDPMAAGISRLDFGVIIPLFIGIASTAMLLARAVNFLFKKYYSIAFHTILGIVIASTMAMISLEFKSFTEVLLSAICFGAGFIIALSMELYGEKIGINKVD